MTGSFGTAALALVAFVLVERRVAHPLLDLSLLRKPAFVGVMAGALAFNGVAFGVIPYLSIWMQTVLGMSPVRGGLTLLPLTGATMVVAILAGKLLHWAPFDALTCGYPPTCTNAHRFGPYRPVPARIKPFQPAVMFPWEHHTGTVNA